MLQACPLGPGGVGGGGAGAALQFAQRHPDVYAPAPGVGDGRLPASLTLSAHVVGGANVQ